MQSLSDVRTRMVIARRAKTFIGHRLREAALYPALPRLRGRKRIVFLPPDISQSSSLLRVYNIAEALRRLGWGCLVIPKQLEQSQRRRLFAYARPDLLFVKSSRHPLNDPALFGGLPFVYDLDDADFHNPEVSARMEATVAQARGVIAGSRYIADWARALNPEVEIVWTGTPVTPGPRPDHRDRPPLVAWAQSRPVRYQREFALVSRVMTAVAARRPGIRLRLYGWHRTDSSEHLDRMERAGVAVERVEPMPYDVFVRSLYDVAVGLAPVCIESPFSRGKSFGKILAYLDAKVPVVASDEVDHPVFFDAGSGVMTNDEAIWAAEIDRLLDDPERRNQMADRAFGAFRERLSLEAATRSSTRSCLA